MLVLKEPMIVLIVHLIYLLKMFVFDKKYR